MKKRINLLREFSIPLIIGVLVALVWANSAPASYGRFLLEPFWGPLNFHFVANELFMVFFFGIAAAEITQSCLPGGDLNPPGKAINPILATLGGVIGPVVVYLVLNRWYGSPFLARGWGIPTATDIAFAWLVARFVFGAGHPVISFILLLAIADDAIGLAIIAVFYPDQAHPVAPAWLTLVGAGMGVAFLFRRSAVASYWPYLILGGALAWTGLYRAHLHPALALVFIVPFLPHPPKESKHLFEEDPADHSTLSRFEQEWKVIVDFGLFLFGLANAGVRLSIVGTVTWLVLAALLIGKVIGIFAMGMVGTHLGFPLPARVGKRELLLAGMIAGIGFTVALFIAGEAFSDAGIREAAKMGAMLSILVAPLAFLVARLMGVRNIR